MDRISDSTACAVSLLDRFANRSAIVGVIGLGYVGLPLALRFSEAGFRVIGFDIDRAKAEAIASDRSYFLHIPHAAVATARERGFDATADFSRAASADALIICVPTPLTPSREPDLSFVVNTIESIVPHLRAGQ